MNSASGQSRRKELLPDTPRIQHALSHALACERALEKQLRFSIAKCRDDNEVQSALASNADEAKSQHDRLQERLQGGTSTPVSPSEDEADISALAPQIADEADDIPEEEILQSLLAAYVGETGGVAMYESLAEVARSAADSQTENLTRQIQTEKRRAAERIWRLLPSRSKIAFNMLTVSEIDPAVETKMADDRIVGD